MNFEFLIKTFSLSVLSRKTLSKYTSEGVRFCFICILCFSYSKSAWITIKVHFIRHYIWWFFLLIPDRKFINFNCWYLTQLFYFSLVTPRICQFCEFSFMISPQSLGLTFTFNQKALNLMSRGVFLCENSSSIFSM